MIGRGDKDSINLLVHDIEHPPVVIESARLGALAGGLLCRGGKPGIIDIHDRHQPFTKAGLQTHLAPPAATNDRDGELRIGGRPRQQEGSFEHCRSSGTQGGLLEERSAAKRNTFGVDVQAQAREAFYQRARCPPAGNEGVGCRCQGCSKVGQRRPKPEVRNPKSEGNPKSEVRRTTYAARERSARAMAFSGFGLRISFGFRVSALRISNLPDCGRCRGQLAPQTPPRARGLAFAAPSGIVGPVESGTANGHKALSPQRRFPSACCSSRGCCAVRTAMAGPPRPSRRPQK